MKPQNLTHNLQLNDGSIFHTETETAELNGYGLLVTPDGKEYLGNFENGKKEGNFVITSKEATTQCSFHNDIQFSEGTIEYSNGDIYTGRMEDEAPNGTGVMKFRDGIEFRGDFEEGLLDGLNCEIHYPNGDIYRGHFSKGIRYTDGIYIKGNK